MSKDQNSNKNVWSVQLKTNPENYLEWHEDIHTSVLAKYGQFHGNAIESGAYDDDKINPVKVRAFYRLQRDSLAYTEEKASDGTIIKRYDELDLQFLKTGLDQDLKTTLDLKKDMGKVFGDIFSTMSKSSKTRVKQWNPSDQRRPISFKDASTAGDYLTLLAIARYTHLDDAVSDEARTEDQSRALNSIVQQPGESIETFADRFERQVRTMTLLNVKIDDRTAARTFIYNLDSSRFLEWVLKLQNPKSGYSFPQTLAEAVTEATKEANSTATVRSLLHRRAASTTEDSAHPAAESGRGRSRSRADGNTRDARKKGNSRRNSRERSKSRDSKRSTDGKGALKKGKTSSGRKGTKTSDQEFSCTHCKTAGRPKRFWRSHPSDECQFQLGEREWAASETSDNNSNDDDSYPAIIEEVTAIGELSTNSTARELTHDSGATVHIFRDKSLLHSLKRLAQPVQVKGLSGTPNIWYEGVYPPLGRVLYYEHCPCNLVSWGRLRASGTTSWCHEKNEFRWTSADKLHHLTFTHNGKLYIHALTAAGKRPSAKVDTAVVSSPVFAGGRWFSERERRNAAEARQLHARMCHMSPRKMKELINSGGLLRNRVTAKALDDAETIFGKCQGCLKGKCTSRRPKLSPDTAAVGRSLHVDILYLKGARKLLPVLLGTDSETGYMRGKVMESKSTSKLEDALRSHLAHFNAMGIKFNYIASDRESNIQACEPLVNQLGVSLRRCSTEEHDGVAERSIRTIKDHMRATIVSLPFKCPPRLVKHLLADVIHLVNMAPNPKTSPLSPREKCEGRKLDVEATLRAGWGDTVLVLDKVVNSLSPRKVWGVVVGHDFHSQGPVQVWIPARDSIVHESRFDIVDPPQELIAQINDISKDDEDNLSMPLLLTDSEKDAGVVNRHASVREYLANQPPADDEPVAPVRELLGPPLSHSLTPSLPTCPSQGWRKSSSLSCLLLKSLQLPRPCQSRRRTNRWLSQKRLQLSRKRYQKGSTSTYPKYNVSPSRPDQEGNGS